MVIVDQNKEVGNRKNMGLDEMAKVSNKSLRLSLKMDERAKSMRKRSESEQQIVQRAR